MADMWHEVLSFAQRPSIGTPVRGTLCAVDVGIAEVQWRALAADAASTTAISTASIETQDCSEHLRDVVQRDKDAVRVDCHIDEGSVVSLFLMIHSTVFDAHMARGGMRAEVALVALAMDVWREARVPSIPASTSADADTCLRRQHTCSRWREDEYSLFPHQLASLRWMQSVERDMPRIIRYAGNLRMTDTWYIDTESQSFTTDPSWREAHLGGGICSDGTGTGKTATILRLVAEAQEETDMDVEESTLHVTKTPRPHTPWSPHYAAHGTLIILPLNLVSQWQNELAKFLRPSGLRTVWLVQGKDVRHVTLRDLCEADLVFTTFHFLRASKPYTELVDAALGHQVRSRAVLTAWARQPGHVEPVVEAVYWRRVVVDEIHQAFESTRELRQLRLLQTRVMWGLTATPVLHNEHAQHLYLFLCREKGHHPNLLARLIVDGVRGTPSRMIAPTPELQLVQLNLEERLHLQSSDADSVEEEVKLCTFVHVSDHERAGDAGTLEEQFRQSREEKLLTLHAKAAGYERAVEILERAGAELEEETIRLAERCASGDVLANAQAEAARASVEANARDLAQARQLQSAELAKAERCAASERFVRERIAALRDQADTCSICLAAPSGAITPCAHLFCSACVRRHLHRNGEWCPTCRAPLRAHDLVGVTLGGGIGSKMAKVGERIASLAGEPVILFVQWRQMKRSVAAYLRGVVGCRVLQLDGNVSQRGMTLAEFAHGGTLLLCLEDSFAGLHLPHVRHVFFAHAIVADRARVEHLERQAIARCVRHGQTGAVEVASFVVADCAEERVWRRTHE